NPNWHILGDPVEGALLVAAAKAGLDEATLAASTTRLQGFPYEPRRQMMSVVVATAGKGGRAPTAYVRGTGVVVLPLCTNVLLDGEVVALDPERRAAVAGQIDCYAREGMRV